MRSPDAMKAIAREENKQGAVVISVRNRKPDRCFLGVEVQLLTTLSKSIDGPNGACVVTKPKRLKNISDLFPSLWSSKICEQ